MRIPDYNRKKRRTGVRATVITMIVLFVLIPAFIILVSGVMIDLLK